MHVIPSARHGGAGEAVHYVLGDKDAKGVVRAEVTLLRGCPSTFIELADRLSFVETYDSFVVSFRAGEEPSPELRRQFLREFEEVMFPGLKARVPVLAVLHGDGHSQHLHILVLRLDLLTNKQCSAAAFGSRPLKELCRLWNARHQWADVNDLFRQRLASWSRPVTVLSSAEGGALTSGDDVHEQCRRLSIQAVLSNTVHTQQDMARWLGVIGRVVSCAKHWIALTVPGIAPRGQRKTTVVRLVGLLYSREFDRARILSLLAPTPILPMDWRRNTPREDAERALVLQEELDRKTRKRAALLRARFTLEAERARHDLTTHVFRQARLEQSAHAQPRPKSSPDPLLALPSNLLDQPPHHVPSTSKTDISAIIFTTLERGRARTLFARGRPTLDTTELARTLSHAARQITYVVCGVVRRAFTKALQALLATAPATDGHARGERPTGAERPDDFAATGEVAAGAHSAGPGRRSSDAGRSGAIDLPDDAAERATSTIVKLRRPGS